MYTGPKARGKNNVDLHTWRKKGAKLKNKGKVKNKGLIVFFTASKETKSKVLWNAKASKA